VAQIKLKVGELTRREEFGKGIARLDTAAMSQLGIKESDVIEIKGTGRTGAIAVRAYPSDVGLNVIRMDGLVRKNAGTSLGEYVQVSKAEVHDAKSVVLAPTEEGLVLSISPDLLKRNLYMRVMTKGDIIVPSPLSGRRPGSFFEEFFGMDLGMMTPFGTETKLAVVSTIPAGIVRIVETTEIQLRKTAVQIEAGRIPTVTYEDIGGLHQEIQKVREMIELPLKHPELFERLGIESPKGVLLHGPPGTGKTLLAKAVANEAGAYFLSMAGPECMSKWYGQSEKRLRDLFDEAEKNAPSIIFIDEIDAIAPKREMVTGEVERRVVSQLLTLMDGLKARGKVIVIAATNRVNSLDPALRRPGRFDREIEIGVPDKKGRKEILQIHSRHMPLTEDVNLDRLADITYGFVGADLEALCKEAAMHALRRVMPEISGIKEDKPIPTEILEKLKVNKQDFEYAMRMVEPSAMREVLIEVPKVKWSDVGGLEDVKKKLREAVEWPLKYPDSFKRMGIRPPKGILLYGPPGCGKTLLARAVASESEANFISIKGPEVLSMWVGESERKIRELFRKAKQVAPCIIFLDEVDALVPRRGAYAGTRVTETVVSQILTEMSGLEELKDVVVLAATNRPDMVDAAILRPGRFDRQILIPAPDEAGRLQIFKIHTKNMPLAKDVKLKQLAAKTDGYSGADIEHICREAAMNALRQDMHSKEVKMSHFMTALRKISPSITQEIKDYFSKLDMRKMKREQEKEEMVPYVR
jgi:transitional endoplasmic reticulum ATPase